MAFIDIKDPKKRDAIVADYLATIHRVRQQNENDKAIGLVKQVDLEKTFNPIIEKTADAIAEKLKTPHPPPPPILVPTRKRKRLNEFNAFDYITDSYDKKSLDKYYGIQRGEDEQLMMGDKNVTVDKDSNITVDNKTYKATTGLWSLIMLAAPKGNTYNHTDLANYSDLAQRTNVMNHPRGLRATSRPMQTVKYQMLQELEITAKKEEEDEEEEEEEEDEEEEEEDEKDEEKQGTGVQFLPGDIKGLNTKLNLLLGEYRAGNKSSTRNEIVSILDELRRRKRISHKDYRDITEFIAL